jgi:N-acetylglucosaminyldiphosphoundecaprenol N-acetyl-beta-D-mannosaminyltransferase
LKQTILGLSFDALTEEQAVHTVLELRDQPGGRIVITAGTEHVMMARRQPELAALFNTADLLFADGIGVVKASRILEKPLPERVGGVDLAQALFPHWAGRGDRLFLFGGKPGVAQQAAEKLQKQYPGLQIAGCRDGYGTDAESTLDSIALCKPDVLLVCLGAPLQERWMAEHRGRLGDCLMMGLGGSLDIWAGHVRRAPALFIRLHLEWFWRLLLQPRRIGRILKLPGIYRAARKEKKTIKRNNA